MSERPGFTGINGYSWNQHYRFYSSGERGTQIRVMFERVGVLPTLSEQMFKRQENLSFVFQDP